MLVVSSFVGVDEAAASWQCFLCDSQRVVAAALTMNISLMRFTVSTCLTITATVAMIIQAGVIMARRLMA
jgi:hypothetical protein